MRMGWNNSAQTERESVRNGESEGLRSKRREWIETKVGMRERLEVIECKQIERIVSRGEN